MLLIELLLLLLDLLYLLWLIWHKYQRVYAIMDCHQCHHEWAALQSTHLIIEVLFFAQVYSSMRGIDLTIDLYFSNGNHLSFLFP